MTKKFLSLIISAVLLFSTSTTIFAANSPEDTISENKTKFQALDNKIIETNLQVNELNSEIQKLNTTITKNTSDIAESNKQIKTANTKMQALQKEVKSNQDLADKRVRSMYKSNYNTRLTILLLASSSFSDFCVNLKSVEKIISFDKTVLNDLKTKKEDLNKIITNLQEENQKLQTLKNSNVSSLQQLNNKKKELSNLVKKFNEEKQAAASIIKENEEKLIAHSLSVVDSKTTSISDVKSAVATLKSLLSGLNTDSVQKKAKDYIELGNKKLATMIAAGSNNPRLNNNNTYKTTYSMASTAYAGHTLTAIGLRPVRDANGISTVAVDPSILPLGTKVYISNYGYAICADTGDAIKGNIVDLYMNSEEECEAWGRRNVTVSVVAYPGEW